MKSKLTRYFTIGQVTHESKDGKFMMSSEVIPVIEKLEDQLSAAIKCYEASGRNPNALHKLIDDIQTYYENEG